jgi:hypothetical protein
MAKVWAFTVEGKGDFPFDMLRYDACYPAATEDTFKFCKERFFSDLERHEWRIANRKVNLRSTVGEPTPARWASFGWKVVESRRIS